MRRSFVLASLASSLVLLSLACSSSEVTEDDPGASEDAVSTRNLMATQFGLKEKELALTLDDGPGPRTVELAEFLAREKIPTTWFMVGKNAAANPRAVDRIVELSRQNNGLFIVANHSMNHQAKPLPTLGTQTTINEIMQADAVLKDDIAASQAVGYSGDAVSFFRPPYGDLVRLGSANIDRVNAAGAAKYIGPVFWDIGGELKNGFAADWACWGKVTIGVCTDGYIAEATAKKRGIVLAHDVHSKTVDMLTGTNGANGRSLILDLKERGFKFVSLRANDQAVQAYGQTEQTNANSTAATIQATIDAQPGGRTLVDVKTTGGAKVSVAFDALDARTSTDANRVVDVTLGPGSHYVTIAVLGADGTVKKQERFSFVVPGTIEPNSIATQGTAACVKLDLLRQGQQFNIFHGKTTCGTQGAQQVPGTDECYKYKATLSPRRDPTLVGAHEWSAELDMRYAGVTNDTSKVEFVIDAESGDIEGGRRFEWRTGTRTQPDAQFEVTENKCAEGQWRGKIHYGNGSTEDFLYRRAL